MVKKSTITRFKEWVSKNLVIVVMAGIFIFIFFLIAYSTRMVPNTYLKPIYAPNGTQIGSETITRYSPADYVPLGAFSYTYAFFLSIFFILYTKLLLTKEKELTPLTFEQCLQIIEDWWYNYHSHDGTLLLNEAKGNLQMKQLKDLAPVPKKWWIQVEWIKPDESTSYLIFGLEPYKGWIQTIVEVDRKIDLSDWLCPKCGSYMDVRIIDESGLRELKDIYSGFFRK